MIYLIIDTNKKLIYDFSFSKLFAKFLLLFYKFFLFDFKKDFVKIFYIDNSCFASFLTSYPGFTIIHNFGGVVF